MGKIDDNGLAIIALMIIVGVAVIFHVDGTAGNIASAACGSLGTLLTSKIVNKGHDA
jgi:uncharacterized membrane protein